MCWSKHEYREWLEQRERADEPERVSFEPEVEADQTETPPAEEPERERELVRA
jgi:hypothetical protein